MRMAVGLVAILIGVGVMVWIMHAVELPAVQQAVNVKKKVEPQVQQMAGTGTNGVDARQSIKLDAEMTGGKMTSVDVTSIDVDGPMAKYFGLQKGDAIVEIATQGGAFTPVKEMSDPAAAKDDLLSSFQNSQQIIVVRNGQRLTLPVPPPSKSAQSPSAAPAPGSALQNQLDQIQKVPTH
jgi:hypothetical protein